MNNVAPADREVISVGSPKNSFMLKISDLSVSISFDNLQH